MQLLIALSINDLVYVEETVSDISATLDKDDPKP